MVEVECATGSTIEQVYAAVHAAKPDIHPNLIKLVAGTDVLDPQSNEIFPSGTGPLTFIKKPTDCEVKVWSEKGGADYPENTIIQITSDRFPGGKIRRYAPLEYRDELHDELVGPSLLTELIPRLSALYEERKLGRPETLTVRFSLYNDHMFPHLVLGSAPNFENHLYVAITYGNWFEEKIAVDIRDFEFFNKLFHGLFHAFRSHAWPELEWIRKEIHSEASRRFPDETHEVLGLFATERDEETARILRQAGLLPEATLA